MTFYFGHLFLKAQNYLPNIVFENQISNWTGSIRDSRTATEPHLRTSNLFGELMKDHDNLGVKSSPGAIAKWMQKYAKTINWHCSNSRLMASARPNFGWVWSSLLRQLKSLTLGVLIIKSKIIAWTVSSHLHSQPFLSAVVIASTIVLWFFLQQPNVDVRETEAGHEEKLSEANLQVRLFKCRTTHRRLFPAKHSFSYSYFMVGVPICWRNSHRNLLATNAVTHSQLLQKTGFTMHADDYLARGQHEQGLVGKLNDYLQTQGVSMTEYSCAYLVTAPRFCGFSFNPVSFWYLHDKNHRLSAMILEVNNTFDERRMYFLRRDQEQMQPASTKFHISWEKDFHVSPFNDRDGRYGLTAVDPGEGMVKNNIDNTIVLKSAEGKPKIVARVFSTEPGIEAYNLSTLQIFSFLLRWSWVGFLTNPRILREALILWVKKVQVFYRPEVLPSSIGRTETPDETKMEVFFCQFLLGLSKASARSITYIPAAGPDRAKPVILHQQDRTPLSTQLSPIEVNVVTPEFYTELTRGKKIQTTLDRFCFRPSNREKMMYVSDHDGLQNAIGLLQQSSPAPAERSSLSWLPLSNHGLRSGDNLLLTGYKTIQNRLFQPMTGSSANAPEQGSFSFFVHSTFPTPDVIRYEGICLKILLADRLALGYTRLLMLYVRVAWLVTLCASMSNVVALFEATHIAGVTDALSLSIKLILSCWLGSLLG